MKEVQALFRAQSRDFGLGQKGDGGLELGLMVCVTL